MKTCLSQYLMIIKVGNLSLKTNWCLCQIKYKKWDISYKVEELNFSMRISFQVVYFKLCSQFENLKIKKKQFCEYWT